MNYWLILGEITVTVSICLGTMFLVWRKLMAPVINDRMEELHTALAMAEKVTKGSMTVLSEKGVQARELSSMEDDIFQSILNQYPEIEQIAAMIAPDFLDKLKSNPQAGLALLERWAPYLEKLGFKTGSTNKQPSQYDLM